jgi:hypothetical protein
MNFSGTPVAVGNLPLYAEVGLDAAFLGTPGCDTCGGRTTARFGAGVGIETPILDTSLLLRVTRFRQEGFTSTGVQPALAVSHTFPVSTVGVAPFLLLEGRNSSTIDAALGARVVYDFGGEEEEYVSTTIPCSDTVAVMSDAQRQDLRRRKAELEAEIEAEAEFEKYANDLNSLSEFLDATGGEAEEAAEHLEDLRAHIKQFGAAVEASKLFANDGLEKLKQLEDATGSVADGTSRFADATNEVGSAVSTMNDVTAMLVALDDLSRQDAAQQIAGLADAMDTMMDALGGLPAATRLRRSLFRSLRLVQAHRRVKAKPAGVSGRV